MHSRTIGAGPLQPRVLKNPNATRRDRPARCIPIVKLQRTERAPPPYSKRHPLSKSGYHAAESPCDLERHTVAAHPVSNSLNGDSDTDQFAIHAPLKAAPMLSANTATDNP